MRPIIVAILVMTISLAWGQEHHGKVRPDRPEWVQLMYGPDPDPGAVQAAYDAYYAVHPFVKNTDTQYFKRWKRELGRAFVPKDPTQRADYEQGLRDYLETSVSGGDRAANWTCLGPFDWDHTAVDRSYAPGSAHVFTVEMSPSDPDILYAFVLWDLRTLYIRPISVLRT